jgi:hypothetical protein
MRRPSRSTARAFHKNDVDLVSRSPPKCLYVSLSVYVANNASESAPSLWLTRPFYVRSTKNKGFPDRLAQYQKAALSALALFCRGQFSWTIFSENF